MNQRQYNYTEEYNLADTIKMSKRIAELKERGILYNVKAVENGWILIIH